MDVTMCCRHYLQRARSLIPSDCAQHLQMLHSRLHQKAEEADHWTVELADQILRYTG